MRKLNIKLGILLYLIIFSYLMIGCQPKDGNNNGNGGDPDGPNPLPKKAAPVVSFSGYETDTYEGRTGDTINLRVTVTAEVVIDNFAIYKIADNASQADKINEFNGKERYTIDHNFEYVFEGAYDVVEFRFSALDTAGQEGEVSFWVTRAPLPPKPVVTIKGNFPDNYYYANYGEEVNFDVEVKTVADFKQLVISKEASGFSIGDPEIITESPFDTLLTHPFSQYVSKEYAGREIIITFTAKDTEEQTGKETFTIEVAPLPNPPTIEITNTEQYPDFSYTAFFEEIVSPGLTIKAPGIISTVEVNKFVDGQQDPDYHIFEDYSGENNTEMTLPFAYAVNGPGLYSGQEILLDIKVTDKNQKSTSREFIITVGVPIAGPYNLVVPNQQGSSKTFFHVNEGKSYTKAFVDSEDNDGDETKVSHNVDFGLYKNGTIYDFYAPTAFPGGQQGYDLGMWLQKNETYFLKTDFTLDDLRLPANELSNFLQAEYQKGMPSLKTQSLAGNQILIFKTDPDKQVNGGKYGFIRIISKNDFDIDFEFWLEN